MSAPPEPSPPASLRAIQELLGGAFCDLVPLAERPDLAADIERVVAGNDRLSPREQADIYREQYWLRHRDVLRDDYPGLRHVLGVEGFDRFARDYLLAHPPRSYTLRDLGNDVADFAERYAGFDPERAALARDMARFELAFIPIFDGPHVEPLTLERVQGLPPEAWSEARIVLHPLLVLLALDHPVHDVRTAVKRGGDPPLPAPAPTHLALWRHRDLRVHYRTNERLEHRLLERLREGATLVDACNGVAAEAADAADFAADIQRWFRAWAQRGWIADVAL